MSLDNGLRFGQRAYYDVIQHQNKSYHVVPRWSDVHVFMASCDRLEYARFCVIIFPSHLTEGEDCIPVILYH